MEAMDLTLQQAADLLDAYRKEHKLARIVDPDECRELDNAATASAIRPATRTRSDASRSSGTGSSSKSRRGP